MYQFEFLVKNYGRLYSLCLRTNWQHLLKLNNPFRDFYNIIRDIFGVTRPVQQNKNTD